MFWWCIRINPHVSHFSQFKEINYLVLLVRGAGNFLFPLFFVPWHYLFFAFSPFRELDSLWLWQANTYALPVDTCTHHPNKYKRIIHIIAMALTINSTFMFHFIWNYLRYALFSFVLFILDLDSVSGNGVEMCKCLRDIQCSHFGRWMLNSWYCWTLETDLTKPRTPNV